MRSFLIAGGLVAAVQAFTQPTAGTWGPLLEPSLSSPVTQGETFDITWDPESHPTDGVTVSLVLCRGSGANCVPDTTAIIEKVPADVKSVSWAVPCDLPVGTQSTDTGYGMLIIVDGTGEFQYSTQFSVLEGSSCGSTTSSASSSSASSSGYGPGSYSTRSGWGSANGTASMSTYTMSSTELPSSIVYATSTSAMYSVPVATSADIPTATFAAPSASEFTGAATLPTGNVLGLIAGGALAMLAL